MVKNKGAQCLTAEQARTFIKAAKGHDLETLFTIALATGMRKGELLALHWSDIDVETRGVHIHQTLSCRGDVVTSKCERTLVLPSLLLPLLKRAYRGQTDLVFCKSQGQTFNPTKLHQSLADLLEGARLPPLRFHDLRCTTISLLISLGVSIQVVEMLLGFSHTSAILESSFPLPTHLQTEALGVCRREQHSSTAEGVFLGIQERSSEEKEQARENRERTSASVPAPLC